MIAWRKSSYSQTSGTTDCVELADLAQTVGIRDSKHPAGGHLSLSRTALSGLLRRIKAHQLDAPQ
jgi:hypothetical protein